MPIIAYKFWSPTCGPCKKIGPILDNIKEEFEDVQWVSVNTHEDPQGLAKKYDVKFVPTVVILTTSETGKPLSTERHTGSDVMGYYRILRAATQPSL